MKYPFKIKITDYYHIHVKDEDGMASVKKALAEGQWKSDYATIIQDEINKFEMIAMNFPAKITIIDEFGHEWEFNIVDESGIRMYRLRIANGAYSVSLSKQLTKKLDDLENSSTIVKLK